MTTISRSDRAASGAQLVARFRLALLGLALGTCLGAALELAALRHWKSGDQKIPWVILGIMLLGILWYAAKPSRTSVLAARVVCAVGVLGSGFGVLEHVKSNWENGSLDATYSDTWDSLSGVQQWWLAASGGVGSAPSLAPGFLALTGICLALATMGWQYGRSTRSLPDQATEGATSVVPAESRAARHRETVRG